jgi:hypothetical protein
MDSAFCTVETPQLTRIQTPQLQLCALLLLKEYFTACRLPLAGSPRWIRG